MTDSVNEYTVAELLEMDDAAFAEALTDDLIYSASHSSPFQTEQVIRRTLTALLDHIWTLDALIAKRAEDPTYPAERYQASLAFRRHLLSAINVTERRVAWFDGPKVREASAWKDTLHLVLNAIENTSASWVLDEFTIPFGDNMTLRTWRDARVYKKPQRAGMGVAA